MADKKFRHAFRFVLGLAATLQVYQDGGLYLFDIASVKLGPDTTPTATAVN